MRAGRLVRAIREEIADLLQRGIKDPRVGFVSITDVELSSDQRVAKVFCSVFGSDEDKRRALEGLRSATGFMRSAVARRIRLRHAPELVFALDESIERGVRVVDMINKLTVARGDEPEKKPEGQEPPAKPD
ncbi:MAG: 30S ribosome-binding factor RbfA [Bacillota bacterium]|nr:30S ribosome-binding factor RbfA [Bacillota bacterium]